jgi:hypothetical protein
LKSGKTPVKGKEKEEDRLVKCENKPVKALA